MDRITEEARMEFKVSTAAVDGTGLLVVSVEGDLDIATADQLAQPAEVAVNAGCALILDLSRCSFIDSAGLRSVLQAHHALAEVGEPMAIVARSQVRKMLSLTAVDLRVRVFSTSREAIESFRTVEEVLATPPLSASSNPEPTTRSPNT
jgi:anti-sigma B factor antagonist